MAITNINNTCDLWDFVDFCTKASIKPIAGAEIRNDSVFQYILLAKNNEGIYEINKFISIHLQENKVFPARPSDLANTFIIYSLGRLQPDDLEEHEFIGVQTTEINKLFSIPVNAYPGKFVIRHPVTFKDPEMYKTHRLLRAIDRNIVLSKQLRSDLADKSEMFISPSYLLDKFKQYPGIVTNTLQLMSSCSVDMQLGNDKTKKVYSSSLADDKILLEKFASDGMRTRYGNKNKTALERVKKELKIIDDMGFNAYFLITCDIIRYARNRLFFFVGRGSGANSIVAYCLGITDVDPLELDLYFERFLNPQRSVPPDFDIDFSWRDRDEIIDYIFKRYGSDHVCLLGSYSTFQKRAILRELGKVFGLPKEEIDALEKSNLQEDSIQGKIHYYASKMKDFPNHLSIHAGGMLISDKPIHQYTATELPPKGFRTSQMDMHIAEKIGLFKLDILSQRGLGHIRETIELVKQNRGEIIDITQIEKFKRDPVIATKIRNADSIGCFYIESPAMRQLLQKLECDDYLTLVAASSIIRPGVAQSGMMKQYIYRYHHPDDFTYLHPKMKELLEETYGVMVYQEDVIKVAHHFAGLDMAEADVLRRAMSGKYRGREEFLKIREKFFINCREKGYTDSLSLEVWRQIESFGGYSFSKAHSASFAVESYQSLFLKTYYPLEFMVAVINNFGGFYNRELYFQELKKTGAIIHAPCINKSIYTTAVSGTNVHIGFIHLKELEEGLANRIIENRIAEGEYPDLHNFIERLEPSITQLNILIRIGAFRFTGRSKKELLWEANFIQKKQPKHTGAKQLFASPPVTFTLPALAHNPLDDALDEIELLDFPLCNPFDIVDDDPYQYTPAKELKDHLGETIQMLGYLVTTKSVHTIKNELMYFGTFTDVHGDWLDTVHFPDSHQRYPIGGRGFYQMHGKVLEDFGVFSLDVTWCKKAGIKDRKAVPNMTKW
jgi:DNA-directed DNA polymerase III PolC